MPAAEALEGLLQSEVSKGYFTAFYVECGRLDETSPRYTHSNVPGSRLFDLASLTKALSTGPLIQQFLQSEKVSKSDSLERWNLPLPVALQKLSIGELLAHRSGLPAWWNFWMGHLSQAPIPSHEVAKTLIPQVFSRISLGAKDDVYSDLGYILLGFLLESAAGMNQGELFQKLFTHPDLGYAPLLKKSREDFIPSAFCKVRDRLLQGEVHDENCAALGGIAGHAGLFGTGPALAAFLKELYQSPLGLSYYQANAAELPLHSFEGLAGMRRGFGISAAPFHEGKGMGHLGFTGTAFWMHLPSREYVIFLSNRVISGRVSSRITEIRRSVMGYLNEQLR